MNAVSLLQRLHQHRAWVNRNLLAAAESLSSDHLTATFLIGQGSIWKSLVHLYASETAWFEALHGNETFVVPGDVAGKLPGNQLAEGGVEGLADLRDKWATLEQRWTDYLAGLSPESLDEIVYRQSAALGVRLSLRRSDVLLHVCAHDHYTAAQVVNMLRQAGAKLPDTMLIAMARQEPRR